jgi:hypothetical protein
LALPYSLLPSGLRPRNKSGKKSMLKVVDEVGREERLFAEAA